MKMKRKLFSFFLSLFLILSLASPTLGAANGEMDVHFIDVGQGLAILVQSEGENLLYDGGDRAHAEELVEYLKEQQVETIDYMISSHYDEDHLGGLVECLKTFPTEQILGSDYVHTSDLFNTFMNTATANALIVQYPKVGDTFSFGSGSFTVFAPAGIKESDSNSNSLVIKLENGSNSFLFTGDAEETSEQDMISARLNLDCDVLSLGHHGSASSTSWDLLESSTPQYAVVSCGTGNKYDHPSGETMGKLKDMGIPVFRTDKQGTLIVRSDGTSLTWNQEPCNDYSSGGQDNPSDGLAVQSPGESSAPDAQNTNTGASAESSLAVWLSATGEKYHSIPDCGRMNPEKATQISEADAIAQGYEKCSQCFNN